jgi:hypothetical protein
MTDWKPLMTLAEAEAMTRNSAYQNRDLYHGTSAEAALGITTEGFKVISKAVLTYGEGFYVATDRAKAIEYAGLTGEVPTVLTLRVNASNPKVFQTGLDFLQFAEDNLEDWGDDYARQISELLKRQGHDGIEIRELGTLVLFEPRQVAAYAKELVNG